MRVLLVAPFLFVGKLSIAAVVREPALVQKEFEEARGMMGYSPEAAAAKFGELYQETKAPRIQLEWARSLYLAGRLAEAKEQFIDVINKWRHFASTGQAPSSNYFFTVEGDDFQKGHFIIRIIVLIEHCYAIRLIPECKISIG